MKALTIINETVTRQALLEMAKRTSGAWIGIRISRTQIVGLFNVSRRSMVKWIHRVNEEGLSGIANKIQLGRSCRLTEEIQKEMEEALEKNLMEFGLKRNW